MKAIVDRLDILVQKWASTRRSEVSGRVGCVAHHIIGRANHYLRYDKDNLFICTPEEHNLIHSGKLDVDSFIPEDRKERLRLKNIESLRWKPDAIFYKEKLKEWK